MPYAVPRNDLVDAFEFGTLVTAGVALNAKKAGA